MHTWQDAEDRKILRGWIDCLKNYGVFFSKPLDLDLAMLAAFPDAYEAIDPEGRRSEMAVDKAAEVVLGKQGRAAAIYTGPYKDYPPLFPAYRYHFLTHSKPATHLDALTHIKASALQADMPAVLEGGAGACRQEPPARLIMGVLARRRAARGLDAHRRR